MSAQGRLPRALAVAAFLAFALSYFFSAVIRAVTATLAPTLTQEFALSPADLGLLAGGYFLGFAAMQLPLGAWLDRFGPKKVILAFLSVAVVGCMAFAAAQGFASLLLARVLCGVGVSACLMAPLTAYRRWLAPELQQRANAWMLMSGSLGMVASTLPVAYLLPALGWRGVFVLIGGLVLVALATVALVVPKWQAAAQPDSHPDTQPNTAVGYGPIFRHPYFQRLFPLAFFNYGGMVGIQSLWAGPWLSQVGGASAHQAAQGLFFINCCMLLAFLAWGSINPFLARRGYTANGMMGWGMPLSVAALVVAVLLGPKAQWWAWAAYCVLSTFTALSQPAIAMAFPAHMTGRALSAYNLVLFAGVFVVQWGIGLIINAALVAGWGTQAAYQLAFGCFAACCAFGVCWLWWSPRFLGRSG